jgi:hypothetical protein
MSGNAEGAARLQQLLKEGVPLERAANIAGVKVSMRAVLEKRDAVTKELTERITVEDDGTRRVETF